VVSELMKQDPESTVLAWLSTHEDDCFLSSITVGEIERGIELLPSGRKKQRLQEAFREFLFVVEERVLGFDLHVAREWAKLSAACHRKGRKASILDSMIEATALHWDFTIVTRNVPDFGHATTLNPWSLGS
jgi:predicted nucleic acid-binding protein